MIAKYSLLLVNDLQVVIIDDDEPGRRSVTNSATEVLAELDERLNGLGSRRVFYRDTIGRFDEMLHENGRFVRIAPITVTQQEFFRSIDTGPASRPRRVI